MEMRPGIDPTPEQIEARAAECREKWTPEDWQRRWISGKARQAPIDMGVDITVIREADLEVPATTREWGFAMM